MSKLLEEMRDLIRTLHYTYRSEGLASTGLDNTSCFPASGTLARWELAEVSAFLTHLAVKRQVAASTQNQALAPLLFLYKNVLNEELPWLKNVERAKRPSRIPLVPLLMPESPLAIICSVTTAGVDRARHFRLLGCRLRLH